MFTVKQIIENATSLYETKEITIARIGSPQWKQAFDLANELGIETPDVIEFIPPSYSDEEMTQVIEEEHSLSVTREGVSTNDC
ncbi:UpfA, partial [Xenorhabdus sp. GDc328]